MKKFKIYIAGPITGNKKFKKQFFQIEDKLKKLGYKVVNPIAEEVKLNIKYDWDNAIKKDIQKLLKCNSILLLNGWEKSKGAKLEKRIAKDLNFNIFYENSFFNKNRKKIIFLSGKKRVGKGIAAKELKNLFINSEELHFATTVKEWAKKDFALLIKRLNNIFKQNKLNQYITKNKHWGNADKNIISRTLLQIYGTDIFRNRIDFNFWVKMVEEKILNSNKDVFIISDVRFENEIEYFKNKDFDIITIRIERDKIENKDEHESEKALDNYKNFDFIIHNNSTKKEFIKKIKEIDYCCKEKRG